MRRQTFAVSVLTLFFCLRAHAQEERLLLDLCINRSCYGLTFVLLRDGHFLVDADAFAEAKIALNKVATQTVGNRRFVDVGAFGSDAKATLNPARTQLDVTLPANLWAAQNLVVSSDDRRRVAPAPVASAFVNYAINAGNNDGNNSLYLDTGVSRGTSLFRTTAQWTTQNAWKRGLTDYQYDDLDHLRRWTVGDQFAFSNDGLGGAVLLGGIGVTRAFDLDPYLITYPQPTFSGLLQAPGTVDVYKDGVLVAQRQVGAGPFNLSQLGLGLGSSNVRVVIQDPFGGTRTLQQSFYSASQVLAPGLSDFAYELGLERESTNQSGYDSGQPILLARQRYGFSDWLTAGYRLEAEDGLVNFGPSIDLRLPYGELSGAAALSNANGMQGHAGSFSYQYIGQGYGFSIGTQVYSSGYRRIGDRLLSLRPRNQRFVGVSWAPIQRLSLQASYSSLRQSDGSQQRSASVAATYNLPHNAALLLSLTHSTFSTGPADNDVQINLTIPFGRASGGLNYSHSQSSSSLGMFAQRSLPSDTGFGYFINAQNDDSGLQGRGELDYQNEYGRAALIGTRLDGHSDADLLLSGSLLALGGHVFATRPFDTGFALVQVPGIADVEITRENQPIGRTDANGNVLVPGLLPYQGNRIGLDQDTVPPQDAVATTQQMISVPRLGGTVVRFDVHVLRAVRGKVRIEGKPVEYGTVDVVVEDRPLHLPIGRDGSVYFSDMPEGNYDLTMRSNGVLAHCPITVPHHEQPVFNVGELACTR